MGAVLAFTHRLETITCGSCGVDFAVPERLHAELVQTKRAWYCPNGHNRHFTGESDSDKLKRVQVELGIALAQRDAARNQRDAEARTKAQTLGKMKALKGRVKNGVCPCCSRRFVQLARHMATKHPDFDGKDQGTAGE